MSERESCPRCAVPLPDTHEGRLLVGDSWIHEDCATPTERAEDDSGARLWAAARVFAIDSVREIDPERERGLRRIAEFFGRAGMHFHRRQRQAQVTRDRDPRAGSKSPPKESPKLSRTGVRAPVPRRRSTRRKREPRSEGE